MKAQIIAVICAVALIGMVAYFRHAPQTLHLAKQSNEQQIDVSSLSNLDEVTTLHNHFNLRVNFENNTISGNITKTFKNLADNLKYVDLDVRNLTIKNVTDIYGQNWNWEIIEVRNLSSFLGSRLRIYPRGRISQKEIFNVTISYSTSNESRALNWLTTNQTVGKTAPYLYTFFEPAYGRSFAPFQDSPSVKSTFTANIRAPKNLTTRMSAELVYNYTSGNDTVSQFKRLQPLPCYVIALVVGNITERNISDTVSVLTEPGLMDLALWEFDVVDDYIRSIERYTNMYLPWEKFRIVVLPYSFNGGGMENPGLTYVHPTVLVGDRSGASTIMHEIAHQWIGNLVSSKSWEDLWLTEAFTVFLQRKCEKEVYGEEFMSQSLYFGLLDLNHTIQGLINDSSLTELNPDLKDRNPEDAHTSIPYEKGYQFVVYLEKLVGESYFRSFVRDYIQNGWNKSLSTQEFKYNFTVYMNNHLPDPRVLNQISWTTWLNGHGLPPNITNNASQSNISAAVHLAEEYIALKGKSKPADYLIWNNFTTNTRIVFMKYLLENLPRVNSDLLMLLEDAYPFDIQGTNNTELLTPFFQMTISTGYLCHLVDVENILATIGRIKFLLPLYMQFVQHGMQGYAAMMLNHHKDFYTRRAIEIISEAINVTSTYQPTEDYSSLEYFLKTQCKDKKTRRSVFYPIKLLPQQATA